MASLAVRCGLTLPQAADHSLAQLQLLADAADRVEAARLVGFLDAVSVGVSAAMSGKTRGLDAYRRTLLKKAGLS